MTQRRSRVNGTGRRTGRASRAVSTSAIPTAWVVGGIGIAVVGVIGIAVMSMGSGVATTIREPASVEQPAPPQPEAAAPAESDRAGKTPDRPAPPIPPEIFDRIAEQVAIAADKWNESVRAKNGGDQEAARAAIAAAWDQFQAQSEMLDPYMTWYEEADLGGWAMPADYVRLGKVLAKHDSLRVKIQKMPK